ncbi:MAG: hypothetical protein OEY18_18775, partial [Candidatus Aminicenantes bacterium]|nr:hypothetical protein [Candidatus Aminicenantes bacterium]
MVHRRQTEDLLDRTKDAGRVVLSADASSPLRIGTDAIGCGAVAAHMVESVLWVVFDAEDDRIFPKS